MKKAKQSHGLTSYLRARGWDRRVRVLEQLTTQTPTADVLEIVRRALVDREELVRIAALEACGDLKVLAVLPMVAKLLRDRDPLVRGVAAIASHQLGGNEHTLRARFERDQSDTAKCRLRELQIAARPAAATSRASPSSPL